MKPRTKEGVGSDLASRFASLSPQKRALLQQRLIKKGVAIPFRESLRQRGTLGPAPLSFAQERLWFLDQYEPGKPFYNISQGLRLSGPLNIAALERSINELIRRHEALRTTFSMLEGEPVQIIAVQVERSLWVVDLSDCPASERESEARRLAQEEARRPFDLARGPLLRTTLVRLGEDDHVLLLTMHHIVSDGWSMGVLNRELAVLYKAFCHSEPSPLSELPIQYADYAVWQREWLRGVVLDGQLSYWKKQLEGAPGVLDLPTDRPRPAVQNYRGARSSFELSKELSEQLKALGRKENATLFMTLLAAFQALLYRYTGQQDIVVGSPIANRNRTEIEGLVGFFVNTLVLRTDLSGNPSFRELLRRVRTTALEAYDHQDLPFEKLVEELNPERSLSHSPLFQVMFVLQTASAGLLELQGLSLTPVALTSEQSKFDLTLSMHDGAKGLRGSLGYRSDLFDDVTIVRMSGHYRSLLEGIVKNPDRPISELPLLTVAEKHQLLVQWNETEKEYPRERCMHELFEAQVARSPEAAALIFEGQQLTYWELNARANQLAHYLSKHGVGPEVLVGICLERSPEMLVTLLGILKAGGAYLPLDLDYPEDRITFMLQDSDTRLIITERRLAERFAQPLIRVRCLDEEWAKVSQESSEDPVTHVKPENLAYVLYTSGTTGIPKGVLIEHGSLVNYLCWFNRTEIVGAAQLMPFVTKLTFDASVKQCLAPLLRGSPVWILSDAVVGDPERLVKAFSAGSGAALNCVPTLWNALLEIIESNPMAMSSEALSVLLLGGEEFDRSLMDRTRAVFPHAEIWNLYGPTEATANAVAGKVTFEGHLALGKPIDNVTIGLLDGHLQPVPVGVTGELYIGGIGLARGYLGSADLTAEKFIPDPFGKKLGARLYKTGDLARYRQDGRLEFVGRNDGQVKIRGFRIELREIEVLLAQHPSVKESVVVAREGTPGDRRLVAYVVARQAPGSLSHELRRFLKEKLPPYMMPSAFSFLESLPLNANGKLDRNALPQPDSIELEADEKLSAPRTAIEEMVAGVWGVVLKLDNLGIHDDFFELGGHSLLATQVMSRVNQVFQLELPLRCLFEAPTVAGLAERIEEFRRDEQKLKTLPIIPVSREKKLPLSFAQERLWFVDQLEPNTWAYNLPSAVRLRGSLDVAALERTLNEIIRRHESLRTTFSMVDEEAIQVIAPPVKQPLALVDLSDHPEGEREEEARRLAGEEARRPFDLARGPLLRTTLLRLGEDEHVLLLTMHHIVSDGWSMGVLYGELSMLYRAFVNGEPSPLPELPIQYADYALWQREWMQGEVLDSQLSYWKKRLEGIRAVLNLPIKHPRPPLQRRRGAQQSFVLSKELSEQLKALSRRESVTLFMALLAAFQTLLYRYTGQEDICVGSPIACRNRPEVESLIGFFVNSLVLRADFSGDPSFRELLKRVREVCLGAYAHQEFPFQKVVEALHLKRDNVQRSLGQVAFAFQNHSRPTVELSGLAVTPFRTDLGIAKTALTLFVRDTKEGLAGSLNYAADLFEAVTISRMVEHFRTLLNAVVADPDHRLLDLPPFLERSRAELLAAIQWANEQSWQFETDTTEGREQGEL